MIIQFLLSFVVVTAVDVFCILLSGGTIQGLVNGFELPGIIIILALVLFLSGYGKSFCIIFPGKLFDEETAKKLKTDSLLVVPAGTKIEL